MMFTDPRHLRVEDPGSIEGNVVFTYLDAFDADRLAFRDLQSIIPEEGSAIRSSRNGSRIFLSTLSSRCEKRRNDASRDPASIVQIVREGTDAGRVVASGVLSDVKSAMKIDYYAYWDKRGWLP
jgi:tryptophanyl-tRNA synthetase